MKLLICLFALAATAMSDSNEELLKSSSEKFTSNFFQEVAKTNIGKSFVMSAFSAMSPLAQLAIASEGESHDEILKSLALPNDDAIKRVFTDVTKQLRDVKGVDLKVANMVYVRKGETLNEKFAAESKEVFNSGVKNVDFTKSSDAAKEINTWVEDNTNHRIKDLISPDSLDATTAAILVNAIYFKGKWTKPFDKSQTVDLDFHVSKDETIKVPTMIKTENLKYGEIKELDAKIVELPYEGDQTSLYLVLPREIDGINPLIEKLKDSSVLPKAIESMYFNEVQLQLPKFKIETTMDLASVLHKMNVHKLFTPGQAHLNNLLKEQSDVYVSAAIQKAFIEVNEEGAEAAAASAFIMVGASLPEMIRGPKYFKVDRPFYFELRRNNLPLFDGVVIQTS